jgi:hypothetical protein
MIVSMFLEVQACESTVLRHESEEVGHAGSAGTATNKAYQYDSSRCRTGSWPTALTLSFSYAAPQRDAANEALSITHTLS